MTAKTLLPGLATVAGVSLFAPVTAGAQDILAQDACA